MSDYSYNLVYGSDNGISSIQQMFVPNGSSYKNVLSVFCSDYNLIQNSQIYGSSPPRDQIGTYLVWKSQYQDNDWSYPTVYEKTNYTLTTPETVTLNNGFSYDIWLQAAGGNASWWGPTWDFVFMASGGGGGGCTISFDVKSSNIVAEITTNVIKIKHNNTVLLSASAFAGGNGYTSGTKKTPGIGGSCAVWENSGETISDYLQNLTYMQKAGGDGETGTQLPSFRDLTMTGGSGGVIPDIGKVPNAIVSIYMRYVVQYCNLLYKNCPKWKPSTGKPNTSDPETNNLYKHVKTVQDFVKSDIAKQIKIPETSQTYKYLRWRTLSDATSHMAGLQMLNWCATNLNGVTIWRKDTNKQSSTYNYWSNIIEQILNDSNRGAEFFVNHNGNTGRYGDGQSVWANIPPMVYTSSRGVNAVKIRLKS